MYERGNTVIRALTLSSVCKFEGVSQIRTLAECTLAVHYAATFFTIFYSHKHLKAYK